MVASHPAIDILKSTEMSVLLGLPRIRKLSELQFSARPVTGVPDGRFSCHAP